MKALFGYGKNIRRILFVRSPPSIRFINCNSCGVELQNYNARGKGYYITPETKSKQDTIQDLKYLLFSQDIQHFHETEKLNPTTGNASQNGEVHEQHDKGHSGLICKRCSNLLYQNKYDINDFQSIDLSEIIEDIPKESKIVLMSPLNEFPFHINKTLISSKAYKPIFVLTKSDLLVSKKYLLSGILPQFFKDFFKVNFDSKLSIPVVAISTSKGWNIPTLLSMLGKSSYLLGNANVGKSTLINYLLKKYLGYKLHRNKNGKLVRSNESNPHKPDQEINNMKSFILSQRAGVSYVPNMTQAVQPYKIDDHVIFDMPGYSDVSANQNLFLESLIKKDWLQRIRKTELQNHRRVKKKPYSNFTGTINGSVYTLGGIFYLKAPPGTINKITKYIPGEPYIFKDIDKAFEVFKACSETGVNLTSTHPLDKYCGILSKLSDKKEFVRHIIPPFQGSIEIVIKDIGHILVRPTGSYNYNGLYEIWLPKGLEVCVREPLERLIEKEYERFNKERSVKTICPKDRPIISSTYPMTFEEKYPFDKMRDIYFERTSNDLTGRHHINDDPLSIVSTLHERPPNLYWYYKW